MYGTIIHVWTPERGMFSFKGGLGILAKSIPRIINLFGGVFLYLLFFQMFSVAFFAKIALAYSIGGIILWVSDLGSNNWMIIQYNNQKFDELRVEWTYKLARLLALSLVVAFFIIIFSEDFALAALVFVSAVDLDSDTSVGIRQFIYKPKYGAILQIIKKASQIAPLLVWNVLDDTDKVAVFALILLIPCILTKFVDTKVLGGLEFRRIFSRQENSLGMWLQSGYTSLMSIDIMILAYFGQTNLIVTLAIAKKLLSALFVFGSTLSLETLGASSLPQSTKLAWHEDRNLKQALILSSLASALTAVFLDQVLVQLPINIQGTFTHSVLYSVILITPFTVIGSNLNSKLLGKRLLALSGFQGYASVTAYLMSILIFGVFVNFTLGVILGFVLKLIFEICLGTILLKKH
jgi:hypothetical protein